MSVAHVEVLVEEPSAEAALRVLLPRVLGKTSFAIYAHSGKDELLTRLPERLRGYAVWLPEDWRVVVLIDRDDDDCKELKKALEAMAREAGLATKSRPRHKRFKVVNRLAIEELEAWYFGDWTAVRQAYPKVRATVPAQSKYADPDDIRGGTWETFERILQRAGYFTGGLRKIEAARAVAEHMEPERNTSRSFQVLHEALSEMATP